MAGTYQLLKTKDKINGRARLQYMHKGVRYSNNVPAKNDKEAQLLLALFIAQIERKEYINTNYTFDEVVQIYLERVIKPNNKASSIKTMTSILNVRVLPYLRKKKNQRYYKVRYGSIF